MLVPAEDCRFLADLMENPPKPNERLKEIMSYHQDDEQPPKDDKETPVPGTDKYPK